jgi:phosphatidylserine/phosphatidylglycerophosphate/cardiolipin synthase-like enzyme
LTPLTREGASLSRCDGTAMIPLRLMLLFLVAAACFAAPSPLLAGGNYPARAVLLKNSEYGDALIQGIRESRTSIICSFYLFKITGSRENLPRRIAEELVRACKRGIAVTVVLERSSGKNDRLDDENRQTAAYLSREGVRIYFDSPAVVTHAKAVVIDGRYVFLGSHNLTQSALRHNNELSVRIDSPGMAAEVTAYLERL